MIKTDKIVYHTKTRKEYNWLMKKLEDAGAILKWNKLRSPTKVNLWEPYRSETCINCTDSKIAYQKFDFYQNNPDYEDYEFIEVSDLIDKYMPEYAKEAKKSVDELSLHSRKISQNINQITNNVESYKDTKGKPKLSLVPPAIMFDVARIREYGNNKYPNGGPDNWKKVPIEDYRDAMLRHMFKYIENPEGLDEESGFPHYMHLACNIAFICQLEKEAKEK